VLSVTNFLVIIFETGTLFFIIHVFMDSLNEVSPISVGKV